MYQPNVPIIYGELANKSYLRMDKVIFRGSLGAITLYLSAALFGYLTFA
jgi:amino acid permease